MARPTGTQRVSARPTRYSFGLVRWQRLAGGEPKPVARPARFPEQHRPLKAIGQPMRRPSRATLDPQLARGRDLQRRRRSPSPGVYLLQNPIAANDPGRVLLVIVCRRQDDDKAGPQTVGRLDEPPEAVRLASPVSQAVKLDGGP